ncbi:hypothetical protein P8452_51491 [Trifolium repens]|nr:hypothetical protein P8452_51491 [Trifolium repens]
MFGSRQRTYIMSHMFANELPRGPYQLEFGGRSTEQLQSNQCPKKRSYRCMSQEQIEGLDAFFKLNDHPNESERKELGHCLGLDPSQIKFWFQNKRTKLKTLSQREENKTLKAENEKLRAENAMLRAQMNRSMETNMCGPPTTLIMSNVQQQLGAENTLIRPRILQNLYLDRFRNF